MTIKTYKFMTRVDYTLTCFSCGAEVDRATLIEWQRGYEKEILCDCCLGELYRNEKTSRYWGTSIND